jgi:hypothetical protein
MEVAGVHAIVNRSPKKVVGYAAGKNGLGVHVRRVQVLEGNARGKDRLAHPEKLCVSFEGELLF